MLELTCSRAWPPLVEGRIGDWSLRWADGFTARANSALAIGDPGKPVPAALKDVCDFAHAHRLPAVVQVIQDTPAEHAIADAGWVGHSGHAKGFEVSVQTLSLSPAPETSQVEILDEPTSAWWELATGKAEPTDAQQYVLGTGKIGYGVVAVDGVTAGSIRGAIVGEWLHVAVVEVLPEFRRRGLASALMRVIGNWGLAQGATSGVLQVSMSNPGAHALYASLGWTEHHRYRYWVPAPGSCEDRPS